MSEFSEKDPSGSGSAVAALAIVRALIERLQTSGALSEADVEVIFQDALRQADFDQLRQDRLEAITMATFDLELRLEQSRANANGGSMHDVNSGPFPKIEALQALYFPELEDEFSAVKRTFLDESRWLRDVSHEARVGHSERRIIGNAMDFQAVHLPFLEAIAGFRRRVAELART